MNENLYVAYFVMVYEEIWFDSSKSIESKKETSYGLQGQLFLSNNLENAYELALEMVVGMSDSNHDGKGDLSKMYSTGINHLEELDIFNNNLHSQLTGIYGLDCGLLKMEGISNNATMPKVKGKSELIEQ